MEVCVVLQCYGWRQFVVYKATCGTKCLAVIIVSNILCLVLCGKQTTKRNGDGRQHPRACDREFELC